MKRKLSTVKRALIASLMFGNLCHAQNALNKYIFAKKWSPVPDHATEIVPGAIIEVPLDGRSSYEVLPLNDQQQAIKIDNFTGMWDMAQGATSTGVDAGVSGITQIFGGAVSGGFKNDTSVSATKIEFNSFKLASGQRAALFTKSGSTFRYIRDNYDPERIAYYLVTEVATAKSAEVKSSQTFDAHVSLGTKDAGSCTAPTLPDPIGEMPKTAGDLKKAADHTAAAPAAPAPAAAPAAAAAAPAAAAPAAPAAAAAGEAAHVRVCHGGPDHVVFDSAGFLPIAMKAELITSRGDTDENGVLDTAAGARPLPTWDNAQMSKTSKDAMCRAYHNGVLCSLRP